MMPPVHGRRLVAEATALDAYAKLLPYLYLMPDQSVRWCNPRRQSAGFSLPPRHLTFREFLVHYGLVIARES